MSPLRTAAIRSELIRSIGRGRFRRVFSRAPLPANAAKTIELIDAFRSPMPGCVTDARRRPAMLPRLARVSDIRSTDAATFATFLMHDERPEKGLVDRRPAAKGSTASCCWVSETPAAAERPDLLELLSRLLSATVERRSLLVAQDVLRPDIAD